jgi:hypothetical protein
MQHDKPYPSAAQLRETKPTIVMFNGCIGEYLGEGMWRFYAKGTLMFGLRDLERAILTGVCVEDEVPHPACLPVPNDPAWIAAVMKAPPVLGIPVYPGSWMEEYLKAESVSKRKSVERKADAVIES